MDLVALLGKPDSVGALIAKLEGLSDATKMDWALQVRLAPTPKRAPQPERVAEAERTFDHIKSDGSATDGWLNHYFDRDVGYGVAWLRATALVGDAAQALALRDRAEVERLSAAFMSLE